MIFDKFKDNFDYTWIRELWQFSDLEIRLKTINDGISSKIINILDDKIIKDYDLVWNYLNINFNDSYLKELFLSINLSPEKADKDLIVNFFSPNPWQNIHLWVFRNLLIWSFITNLYKTKYSKVNTETLLCDSWEVFDTMLTLYKENDINLSDSRFWVNPLFEYENQAKKLVKNKESFDKLNISDEKRSIVTNFSLNYFNNQLDKLWMKFDNVSLQSDFTYIDDIILSSIEERFQIYKDWKWLWIYIDWQKNPQMLINQNWMPTYLFREINWILSKYNEWNNDFLFIVWTDQKHHFKIVKEILSTLYDDINIDIHFHSMIVLKDWNNKQSAKTYTLDKLADMVDVNERYLLLFTQESIILLHLMSDMFIAKKDKEVVFSWEYENREIATRIINNFEYLNTYNGFIDNSDSNTIKNWLELYKWILTGIDKKETSFVINSLSVDIEDIKFKDKEELDKYISIFKYWLNLLWIKTLV